MARDEIISLEDCEVYLGTRLDSSFEKRVPTITVWYRGVCVTVDTISREKFREIAEVMPYDDLIDYIRSY